MIYHQSKVDINHKAKEVRFVKNDRYFNWFPVNSNGGVSQVNDYNCKMK